MFTQLIVHYQFSLHQANILQLERFLDQYRKKIETNNTINYLEYNSLIEEFFTLEDTSISSREQFQKSIFNKELIKGNREIIRYLKEILSLKNFRIDTKNWITLILNTHNEKLIKLLLNQLFTKNRTNSLEKTDFHIAITYLLKRNFKNRDLLNIIKTNNPELYIYISEFCVNQNVPYQFVEKLNIYSELNFSIKSSKLYFLYLIELSKKNYFNAFAYYKTYFDSMTAEFDHYLNPNKKNGKKRKINYRGFYTREQLKKFYNFDIKDKHTIIDEAYDLRNENPLNHSSAKLLTGDKAIKNELTKMIFELQGLLDSKIKELL